MAFLDDLSKKLTMVGQEAASQTKAFAETTRINAKISDEERQINAYYTQLGRIYFDENKDNPNAQHIDLITNIMDAMHRIEMYKVDIRRAKGVVGCPNCGSEVPINVSYCSYCGAPIPPQQEYIPNSVDLSGGVEGLGNSVANTEGVYATPNPDGTTMNYGSGQTAYDITSLNMNNSIPQPSNNLNKHTVSLEKK